MPTDPSAFPADLWAGPYGFLVAIAFFAFLGLRELRRYRQIDVTTYRADIAGLKSDLANLRGEIEALRDKDFENSRAASAQRELLIRENAGLRALLAEHNISTDGIR